jgi:cytochrome c oxidase subunit 4
MTDMTTTDHAQSIAHFAPATTAHDAHEDTLLPTSKLFGRIELPVPLYTAVFGLLAILTIIEVIIAELPSGWLGTALLIILSTFKACLVVWFYMHLRSDNKLYALALIIPFFLGLVATFFLIAVPMTGYGY